MTNNTRLNKNSRNSTKPPSSDGLKKPKTKSLRKKSTRMPGGQPGHIGQNLERIDQPDQTLVLTLVRCSCHHFLGNQLVINHECRQVFELPKPKLKVTEYQAEIKKCTGCGKIITATFPENVIAPAPIRRKSEIFSTLLPPPAFYPRSQNQPIVAIMGNKSQRDSFLKAVLLSDNWWIRTFF